MMNKTKKKIRALQVILIVLASIIVVIAAALGIYMYSCTHYWQSDYKKTIKAGFTQKQYTLDDGSVINYAEGPDNGEGLLLIHGQTGIWESYSAVLPELSKNWHVFAVDCYGHGGSSHDEAKYYLKENGDDLIAFVQNVIKEPTVVSGHSSGGLLSAYVAAYGGECIVGTVLEDPPVFSTEPDYFEKSFAYIDTYKSMHEYINSDRSECWEAYYLRNCYWGRLYMADSMPKLADDAQRIHEKNPDKPVQFSYMPASINQTFQYVNQYDFMFGEHFYDYTWHSGISHEKLMSDINVPTVFVHALDMYSDEGILMAASSNEQARRAVELIGSECTLTELESGHLIHCEHPDVFIEAVNSLLSEQ